jgi:ketosteroid isomerase-like protein
MKVHIALLLTLCLIGAVSAQAANDLPKPTAGHKKMLEWCGQYDITGKTFTTPLGPGREIKGTWIGRPILDGFAIEGTYFYEGKGPSGETQAKEITSYDPATNTYHYVFLSNNGYREQAPFTVDGPVAAWKGTVVVDGKTYEFRGRDTDLPDGTGFIRTGEVSTDGTTWQPQIECRHIKAQTTSDEQELIKLEQEAWKAAAKGNLQTVDRILADEFIGIYGDSEGDPIWTKQFLISALKSGRYVLTSIDYTDMKVRIDGTAAAVSGITTTKETFDGADVSGRYRFTSTWIKGPAGWQCVADHGVMIPGSGPNATEAAKAIEGLWSMQAQKIDGAPDDRENRKALKFYQDGTFLFVDCDTSTGKIEMAGGGDYTFDGKTLIETVHFVNLDEYLPYRGTSFEDHVRFEGDTFHQSGTRLGTTLEEVWKRVTPK